MSNGCEQPQPQTGERTLPRMLNNRISGVSLCLRRHQPVCLVRDPTAANWDSNSHRVASIFPSKSFRRLWDRYPTMAVTPFNCLSILSVTFSSISAWPSFTFNHHCTYFVAQVFFAGAQDSTFPFQPFFNNAHAAARLIFNDGYYVTLY